jgi:hypothetical protein
MTHEFDRELDSRSVEIVRTYVLKRQGGLARRWLIGQGYGPVEAGRLVFEQERQVSGLLYAAPIGDLLLAATAAFLALICLAYTEDVDRLCGYAGVADLGLVLFTVIAAVSLGRGVWHGSRYLAARARYRAAVADRDPPL